MNEFEYCYWLMGIFELGTPTTLNAKQTYLIKEHLNLVKQRKYIFCNWLENFLGENEKDFLDNNQLNKILKKLRLEFLNIIDKSYPKELWSLLQTVHDSNI